MLRTLLISFIILIATFKAHSQEPIFSGIQVDIASQVAQSRQKQLLSHLSEYEIYQINTQQISDFVKIKNQASFQLKLGNEHHWKLELQVNDLQQGAGFSTLVRKHDGIHTLKKREVSTYKGHIKGDLASSARLSIREGNISGLIISGGKSFYIEPASRYISNAKNDWFVVYDPKDVIISENAYCSIQKVEETEAIIENQRSSQFEETCKKAKIAIAVDKSMLNKFGTVENVEDEILDILNVVEGRYLQSEINIAYEIRTIIIFESDNPWVAPNSLSDLLGKFRVWGNNGGFQTLDFATATLWTATNFGPGPVGLAWLSSTCGSFRYHVNNHFTNNKTQLVQLHAHELGHNWSAQHTQNNNNTYIMSPTIGNLNDQWHEAGITAIVNHKSNSSCLITDCDASTNLLVEANFTNINTCYGDEEGAIEITVDGGVAPYSFAWSNGASTQNIENVSGGEYSVIVTDANSETIEVSYFIQQPREILLWNYIEMECGEVNTAKSVNANVSGGNGDFLFSWSSGQDSSSILNVPSGEYVLTVTHKVTGCSKSDTIIVPEYEPMLIDFTNITHSTCGKNNGTVTAQLVGGNAKSNLFWLNQGNEGTGERGDTLVDLAPGTYVATAFYNNCQVTDSVIIDEIPIFQSLESEICEGDSYDFNGISLTDSGIYSDTLQTNNACDSIVQLDLKVNIINTEIQQDHAELLAEQENASYQWLRCGDDFEPIDGATSQNFFVSEDGSYAVEITMDNCIKISSCTDFIILSNSPTINSSIITVFPNPAAQKVHISFPEANNNPYSIYDMSGKIVKIGELKQAETVIDLSSFSDGMYYIQILDQTFKIIKDE